MKSIYRVVYRLLALFTIACDQNDNDINDEDHLAGTSWMATMKDDNPSTNPSSEFGINGGNTFYP